ncbi:MAG TPA: IPT/TIG domain-containing protein [Nitrospira sp.]|nr:IPT/TIG domain-containing protein [Nitrospira sp.]
MQTWRSSVFMVTGLAAITLCLTVPVGAEESSGQGSIVEGAGFTLFDMESIKGFDAEKVERDPVCDRSKRPRIAKVEPDDVKPGDKVVIKGENFGTKECFHTVTFSASPKATVDYKFVNDSTIEATVPEAKPGMSFLIIVAGGGSAQSKPLLIQAK